MGSAEQLCATSKAHFWMLLHHQPDTECHAAAPTMLHCTVHAQHLPSAPNLLLRGQRLALGLHIRPQLVHGALLLLRHRGGQAGRRQLCLRADQLCLTARGDPQCVGRSIAGCTFQNTRQPAHRQVLQVGHPLIHLGIGRLQVRLQLGLGLQSRANGIRPSQMQGVKLCWGHITRGGRSSMSSCALA